MGSKPSFGNLLIVDDVIIHTDIITTCFCCDLDACQGACCIEGDAGAPITVDEIETLEESLDCIRSKLSAQAQSEIDQHGVSYVDTEGDLVTSIVRGKECVFTYHKDGCYLCALECGEKKKPISCALYPIRERKMGNMVGLWLHRWDICKEAFKKGEKLQLPVYKFLRESLIRRFGEEWYAKLETTVDEMKRQGLLSTMSINLPY